MAIGFKHGSSGGDPLGITVVSSSTKPSEPKENTIWVNDPKDYEMGSFAISSTEPHRVSRTRNLIVFPYLNGTTTLYGVTFTVDSTSTSSSQKGAITVNGTNTSSDGKVFRLSNNSIAEGELLLQPGKYVLCGNCESSSANTHRLLIVYSYDNWASSSTIYDNSSGTGTGFTVEKVAKARLSIQVRGDQTVNNAVYKPMLVKEGESTEYTMGNATGQIWVKTDTSGSIFIDAIKGKNEAIVDPVAAYEYFTNNGWVNRDAEVYQYGAWKVLETPWDGYYFKDGEQYTDITGGWSTDGWTNTGTVTASDTIAVSAPASSHFAAISTKNTVDLTDANTLWFDSPNGNNGYGYGYLCVTSAKSVASADDIKASVQVKAGRGSVDVSSLSGKYYITLYATNQSYADVSAIWME